MISSRPGDAGGRMVAFHRSTLHPLIAIGIPLLFLWCLTSFLPLFFGQSVAVPLLFYALTLLAGLEETVVGNILFKERTSSFVRFRELVYLCFGVVLLLFAISRGNVAERLASLKQAGNVLTLIAVPAQWLLTFTLHSALREREFLLQGTGVKEGRELKTALRQNAEQAKEALAGLGKVRFLLLLFQIFVFLLLIVAFALGKPIAGGSLVLVVVHAVFGIILLIVLNHAREDQLLFGDGVNVGIPHQRRRLLIVLAVFLLIFLLVFVFARSSSLLSLSLFESLLDWLSRLFRSGTEAPEPPQQTPREPQMQESMRQALDALGEKEQKPWLQTLFYILGRVLLAAAIVAAVYFLISPLLSRYFRKRIRSMRPLAVMLRKLKGFLSSMKRMLNDLRSWVRQSKSYSADRRRVARREKQQRRRRERQAGWLKRIEVGRILRAYLRLIKWGKRRGIPYRSHLAPQEYFRELSGAVPAREEALAEAVGIMEEVLFSRDFVPRKRVLRYLALMKRIVKERG